MFNIWTPGRRTEQGVKTSNRFEVLGEIEDESGFYGQDDLL